MRFLIAVIVAALISVPGVRTASAFTPKWPSGPYSYLVIDQDIKDVLVEFGHNISVPVKVSDEIIPQRVTGPMPKIKNGDAQTFLNAICEAYGVVWYYDGAILHFSAESEVKSEMINLGRYLRARNVIKKLKRSGISDQRYPIRTTADLHIISVSGPPAYRTLVRQEIIAMAKAAMSGVLVIRGGREGP